MRIRDSLLTSTTLRPGLMSDLFASGVRFSPEGANPGTETPPEPKTDPAPKTEPTPAPTADPSKPTDREAELIKEVMEKKGKLKDAEAEKTRLEAELAKFQGIDPQRAKELIEQAQKAEQEQLERKGEWDKLKAQMVEAHEAEKKALADKLKELEGKLGDTAKTIDGLTVGHAFANSKFIGEELVLTPAKARVIYGDHFDVQDGQVVAYDKPRGAKDRTAYVDGRGNPLDFDGALRKIVEADPDKEQIVRSKAKPGTGSSTTGKEPTPTGDAKGAAKIAAGLKGLKPVTGPLG